ncbi:MAG: hypothetical protein GW911_31065 [Armatimonadetes bacterium]|nr:hypothetical protein [Armatimonadota bacterium]NDK16493.1 hypothetical protein [Armatimonadota bacterium]
MSHPIVDLAIEKTKHQKLQWRASVYPTQFLASLPKAGNDGVLTLFLAKANEGLYFLAAKDENNAELAKVASPQLLDDDRELLARLFDMAERQAYGVGPDAQVVEESLRKL